MVLIINQTQNIEQVLERGERIDLLVDKTDRLGGSARDFRVRSRGLRRRMWYVFRESQQCDFLS